LLSTTTLSGTQTDITGISQSYTNLFVVYKNVYAASGSANVRLRFNSDTGTNYGFCGIQNNNTTLSGLNGLTGNGFTICPLENFSTANQTASGFFNVYQYTSTTNGVIVSGQAYINANGARSAIYINGRYQNTAAITSINIVSTSPTFSAGTVEVYGVN
jgi:hypothetical protein